MNACTMGNTYLPVSGCCDVHRDAGCATNAVHCDAVGTAHVVATAHSVGTAHAVGTARDLRTSAEASSACSAPLRSGAATESETGGSTKNNNTHQ